MNTSLSARRLPTHGGQGPLAWVSAMLGTWRQRHALEQLDDHMLQDIGVSREEADTEIRRPIWDVPGHWLR